MSLDAFVDDFVHEPTQTDGRGVDLTVASIHRVVEAGRVDFGGGELEPAGTEVVPTERRDPDDEYGWWHLEGDGYLLEYNESLSLPEDRSAVIQPREAIRTRGGSHPTLFVESLSPVPIRVSGAGLRVKENARVSTLVEP